MSIPLLTEEYLQEIQSYIKIRKTDPPWRVWTRSQALGYLSDFNDIGTLGGIKTVSVMPLYQLRKAMIGLGYTQFSLREDDAPQKESRL